jgi:SNF2 family DNA or RNA helicase
MSSCKINEFIDISNRIAKNELDSSSPTAKQPPHIKTPLMLHQLTVLYTMKHNEINYPKGLTVEEGETFYSSFGIVGDRVGVGKTLMILGHISQMAYEPLQEEHPFQVLHPLSTPSFYSTSPLSQSTHLFDTLVVVPHSIFKQWTDSITKETTLRYFFVKTVRDLDKKDFIQSIQTSHITLISNTLFSSFLNTLQSKNQKYAWRRVVYDEADNIKIKVSCKLPIARLTWFVTASYNNLLFVNRYFHTYRINQLEESYLESLETPVRLSLKEIITQTVVFYKTISYPYFKGLIDSSHPLRAHTVIKNSDDFLNMSIELPPCHRNTLLCRSPVQQQIVQNLLPIETLHMLDGGDIQGALQSLGVPIRTGASLPEAVTAFKEKELGRLRRRLAFKEGEDYDTPEQRIHVLENLQKKIHTCENEIKSVKKRIEEVSRGSCAICFEVPKNSCVPPCCARPFCGECILTWMSLHATCPLCRSSLHTSQLVSIGSVDTGKESQTLSKHDTVLHILEDNPEGYFLIFSRYDNSFHSLKKDISETLSYKGSTLEGNKDTIGRILEEFEEKRLKVLFLNSGTMGAGMNIQTATHIILLHKMANEEERQIIGRAYRMGRKDPLYVYQLLHESE